MSLQLWENRVTLSLMRAYCLCQLGYPPRDKWKILPVVDSGSCLHLSIGGAGLEPALFTNPSEIDSFQLVPIIRADAIAFLHRTCRTTFRGRSS